MRAPKAGLPHRTWCAWAPRHALDEMSSPFIAGTGTLQSLCNSDAWPLAQCHGLVDLDWMLVVHG